MSEDMVHQLNDENYASAVMRLLNGLSLKEEIRWLENIIATCLKNDQVTIFRTCRQLFYQRLNP